MTTLREIRDRALESVRFMKEAKVRSAVGDDSTDISCIVEGYRGENPAVILMPMDLGREHTLFAAQVAAIGFGADVVCVTTEGWRASDPARNPVTGKPWESGQMQEVVEQHQGLEKGWIYESLTTYAVNRAGDVLSGIQDYRISKHTNALGITRHSIEWEEPMLPELIKQMEGAQLGGVLVEETVKYMNHPTVAQMLERIGVRATEHGLSYEEAMTINDIEVLRHLRRVGWTGAAMLAAGPDESLRRQIIQEQLGTDPDFYRPGSDG